MVAGDVVAGGGGSAGGVAGAMAGVELVGRERGSGRVEGDVVSGGSALEEIDASANCGAEVGILEWVECTTCAKWRVWRSVKPIPDGDWSCTENTWDEYNSCGTDQEELV